MFYYIDQPCTPSFPIGLAKTKSDFIVRSVETDLCDWVFSGCCVPPDSKETELGSSDQEASPSADKNTGIVLVPCCTWKCVPAAISGVVDISKVPGCHLLRQMRSQ